MRTAHLYAFMLLLAVATGGCDAPDCEVLLARSPDSSTGNWGAFPTMLGMHAPFELREDGTLPEGDLNQYKLVVLSTNLNVFEPERRRLWEFVNQGGILVTWFPDDVRARSTFWPYRLELSDHDPPRVDFRDLDHPLLRGLRGKTFSGRLSGGDVIKSWDREHWQVLADTVQGPALLVASYGAGSILDMQFHGPLTGRRELAGPLAENLLDWAGVTKVGPRVLSDRSIRNVLATICRKQMRVLQPGEWTRGTQEETLASEPVRGLHWSYPRGVTLYGMLRVSQVTGNKQFSDYVLQHNDLVARQHAWLRWQEASFGRHGPTHGIAQLMRLGCLDDCGSMGSQVLEGLMQHGGEATPEMQAMLQRIATYIHTKQSRFPDGSLCRGRTLWIDDLYMSVPFLARWGTYAEAPEYWDDGATQIINFASRLQDEDGLWFHGWFDREQKPSGFKWGRGNGWAILSEVELLAQLPQAQPQREELMGILRRHIEGIRRHQAPSGMWRQVVNEPDLWEETSCTGMFAYAIARACNEGWIPGENMTAAEKAFEALKTRVMWDGSVLDTCAGTGIGRSLEHYIQRPRPVNDGHGPGPVLLAGAEILVAQGDRE